MNRKLLITGASGVIGQALLHELKKAGYKHVIAADIKHGDLTKVQDAHNLLEQTKPDWVFHLAAQVYGVMGNLENKAKAYLNNIRINTNVIEAAYQVGVKKIIAMGSTSVYSNEADRPMREEQIWKGAPHFSEASYAHSKRAMLAQLEAYKCQYGMDFAFCVSTNLYGPFDKFDEKWGHVIPSLISKFYRATTRRDSIDIWGTGVPKRDFLFSSDAAYAMRLIAEQFSGPINLATGESYSIKDTVELIKAISGCKQAITWDPTKPEGQVFRLYDTNKLKSLGFKPRYTLEEGLSLTYKWFAQNVSQARIIHYDTE